MQQPDRGDIAAGVDELARAGIGILKPGLSVVDATDVIFGLLRPEPYRVITTRRSWTTQQRQRW